MADDVKLNASSSDGATIATKEVTHEGSTGVQLQAVSLMGITGTEGAYTIGEIGGTSSAGLETHVLMRGSTGNWITLEGTSSAGLEVLATPSGTYTIAGTATVTPSSTMDVAVQNTVTVTPSSTMDVLAVASTGGFAVSGTVTASPSSSYDVTVSSGTVSLSSGVAVSSGTVSLSSGITVSSGTISLSSDPNVTTTVSSSLVNLYGYGSTGQPIPLEATSSAGLAVNFTGSLSANTEYTFGTDVYAETVNIGIMSGAVRNDALVSLVNTDNEIAPLQVDAIGALYVAPSSNSSIIVSSGTVSLSSDPNVSTTVSSSLVNLIGEGSTGDPVYLPASSSNGLAVNIVAGSASGTEYNEDEPTPATIAGTAIMMERDNALSAVTPAEGDWISLRGSGDGALWVQEANSDAILADTANMDTNLGTIAGAVSGGQMQVDIVADGAGLLTTTAHDAAFGTAGSADAQVRSIQGIAGGVAVEVDLAANNDVTVSNTVTVTPSSGLPIEYISSGTITHSSQLDVLATPSTGGFDVSGTITAIASTGGYDVSGTVTANLSATDNAVLDSILSGDPAGGLTIFHSSDLDETEENCSTQACTLYDIVCTHTDTTPLYLSLFNASADAVTVGTTAPAVQILIPASTNGAGAGFTHSIPKGWTFGTALSVAATTTAGGAGGPGAGECLITMGLATSS